MDRLDKQLYHRLDEARQCGVASHLVLPVFRKPKAGAEGAAGTGGLAATGQKAVSQDGLVQAAQSPGAVAAPGTPGSSTPAGQRSGPASRTSLGEGQGLRSHTSWQAQVSALQQPGLAGQGPLAVLEVVQSDREMSFPLVAQLVGQCLEVRARLAWPWERRTECMPVCRLSRSPETSTPRHTCL